MGETTYNVLLAIPPQQSDTEANHMLYQMVVNLSSAKHKECDE